MNKLKTLIAAAAMAIGAVPATAQSSLFDGNVFGGVYTALDDDFGSYFVGVSMITPFGGSVSSAGFSVQGDVYAYGFFCTFCSANLSWNATAHAFTALNATTTLGGFVGADFWYGGNTEGFAGIEAKYESNGLAVEGAVTHFFQNDYTALQLNAAYAIGGASSSAGLALLAQYTYFSGGFGDFSTYGAGLSYALASGLILSAMYNDYSSGYPYIGIGLTFPLGKGATFSRRGLAAISPMD